jgi:hypothetical protein
MQISEVTGVNLFPGLAYSIRLAKEQYHRSLNVFPLHPVHQIYECSQRRDSKANPGAVQVLLGVQGLGSILESIGMTNT